MLIAGFDLPKSDPNMASALRFAGEACAPGAGPVRDPRMRLALAFLDRAIDLRKELHNTPNQVAGSAENMGFAYLRDGNLGAAFANAQDVRRTGLFPWNELVRALAAEQLGANRSREVRTALAEARRNLSFFQISEFNLCELRELLSDAHYREAVEILTEIHRSERVECVE